MLKHISASILLQYTLLITIYSFGLYQHSQGMGEYFAPLFYVVLAITIIMATIKYSVQSIIFISFIIIFSLIASIIAANTSQVYGNLAYGNGLGFKLYNAPVIIGTLWIIILSGSIELSQRMAKSKLIVVLNTALITTVFSVFIDPLVTRLDYWTWQNNTPSIYNYISWFVLAFIFSWVGTTIESFNKNILAGANLFMLLIYLLIIVR